MDKLVSCSVVSEDILNRCDHSPVFIEIDVDIIEREM